MTCRLCGPMAGRRSLADNETFVEEGFDEKKEDIDEKDDAVEDDDEDDAEEDE